MYVFKLILLVCFYCPTFGYNCPCFRDIPAYNKYVLTNETKEALKTPQVKLLYELSNYLRTTDVNSPGKQN